MAQLYDALLVVSFGGPEGPDDVLPFLENVVRGKNVPHQRLTEVAGHYQHLGGKSPLNAQNRALVADLRAVLKDQGPDLKVYLGNRNWHPFLSETLAQMAHDGVRRALALVTSAYSSYSSCRQYLEDIERARHTVGPSAPVVDKLRAFFNHPGFIGPMAERTREALDRVPQARRGTATVIYTAHSIPCSMAATCAYAEQLREAASLVSQELGLADCQIAYQSRSGPPQEPWLGPDILDALRTVAKSGRTRDVVVVPLGFLSDHVEILWDLDVEARRLCDELGLNMARAVTVGSHPQFVRMIRELILERVADAPRRFLGKLGAAADVCPADCCEWSPVTRRSQHASEAGD